MGAFQATETMWDFMQSEAYVRLIAGPVGSGKSVTCCHELVKLAMQQEPNARGERKSRALIVRNTADQLAKTVRKTFFAWFPPGVWGHWKESEKSYYIKQPLDDGTFLDFEVWFMPLDTPQDVQRALSLEITYLYGNEWRELHPEVIDGLLGRLKRYPSGEDGKPTRSCAIFDTNMPDADTWHMNQMEEPPSNWSIHVQPAAILSLDEYMTAHGSEPSTDPIEGYNGTVWYINPGADNIQHLDPTYYADIIPGKSEDYISVYLRCKYGRSLKGKPVYEKTFNAGTHVASSEFIPLKAQEYPIIVGMDFGRTPCVALLQRNVRGQVICLAEETSENMGIETFIDRKLRPLLAQPRFLGCTFLVAPDPAGFDKTQINEITPVDVVKRAGFKVVKPATNNIEPRIQAVERLLSSNIGGKPMFQIADECKVLISGFKHGYKYALDRAGNQADKPDKKNKYSHPHDALQYAALVVEGNILLGEYTRKSQRREVVRSGYAW
jgi:hypothetical protein